MRTWTIIVLTILASGLVYRIIDFCLHFRIFSVTFNHSNGNCTIVQGIEFGSEDIKVLPDGRAFVSSGFKLSNDGRKNSTGGIFLFDFNKPHEHAQHLEVLDESGQKLSLVPHGLGLWINDNSDDIYLYVVNHFDGKESIEKFKFLSEKMILHRVARFTDANAFHKLNSIHLVGEDQFYFTNFFYWNDMIEIVMGLHWGSVGYFSGKEGMIVASGLNVPNGIVGWKDYIIVALSGSGELNVYSMDGNHFLKLKQTIKVNTGVDNLTLDPNTNDVILGCHPSPYKYLVHSRDPDAYRSPSQILRLKYNGRESTLTEIYSNDGSEVSASTVGVLYKDTMLIGTVYTDLLYCKYDTNKNVF